MSDVDFEEPSTQELASQSNQASVATPATLMVDENLMRLARQNPRREEEVFERIKQELQAHPDYAEDLFYSIPYKDNRKKLISFVEGPSIRATEHIWSRWGNCTVAARVADDRGKKIMVQGLYLDHETGLRLFSDLEVDKFGRARNGGTYPLSPNDLRLKVAATESKAKRNAFLSALPLWVKDGYTQMCFDLSMGASEKTIADRITNAKVFFMSRHKLPEEAVLDLIAKVRESYPGIDDKSVLRYLIGIKNSLKDGNIDLDFVFGEEREQPSLPQAKKGAKASGPVNAEPASPSPDAAGDAQES